MDKRINSWLPDSFVEESASYVEESFDIDYETICEIVEEEVAAYFTEEGAVKKTFKRMAKGALVGGLINGGVASLASGGDSRAYASGAATGALAGAIGGALRPKALRGQVKKLTQKLHDKQIDLKHETAPSTKAELEKQIGRLKARIEKTENEIKKIS